MQFKISQNVHALCAESGIWRGAKVVECTPKVVTVAFDGFSGANRVRTIDVDLKAPHSLWKIRKSFAAAALPLSWTRVKVEVGLNKNKKLVKAETKIYGSKVCIVTAEGDAELREVVVNDPFNRRLTLVKPQSGHIHGDWSTALALPTTPYDLLFESSCFIPPPQSPRHKKPKTEPDTERQMPSKLFISSYIPNCITLTYALYYAIKTYLAYGRR